MQNKLYIQFPRLAKKDPPNNKKEEEEDHCNTWLVFFESFAFGDCTVVVVVDAVFIFDLFLKVFDI